MSYKIALLFVIFFLVTSKLNEAKPDSTSFSFVSNKKLEVGEKLSYVVRYAFIALGEVTLKITDKNLLKNKTIYKVEAFIDSYPDIPFVDIHQIYNSILTSGYSLYFKGITKSDEDTTYTEYMFNYDSSFVKIKKVDFPSNKVLADSSVAIDTLYQDGLSLFYYARINSGRKKSENLPCFVNEKKVITEINFYNEPTDVSIDAIDYPVKCVKVDGNLDFVSLYGLTGSFEGWFTDDEAAIPILAKMKVMVGNITLELKEWERKGWNPPEFQE